MCNTDAAYGNVSTFHLTDMRLIISVLLTVVGVYGFAQDTTLNNVTIPKYLEKKASYPGGQKAILEHFKYTTTNTSDCKQRIWVKFVVNVDGSTSQHQIIGNIVCDGIDQDAINAVITLPDKWIPGTLDGKATSSWYKLAYSYDL